MSNKKNKEVPNAKQRALMDSFEEKHPNLSTSTSMELWQEYTDALNNAGPPVRTMQKWQRSFKDKVRRKNDPKSASGPSCSKQIDDHLILDVPAESISPLLPVSSYPKQPVKQDEKIDTVRTDNLLPMELLPSIKWEDVKDVQGIEISDVLSDVEDAAVQESQNVENTQSCDEPSVELDDSVEFLNVEECEVQALGWTRSCSTCKKKTNEPFCASSNTGKQNETATGKRKRDEPSSTSKAKKQNPSETAAAAVDAVRQNTGSIDRLVETAERIQRTFEELSNRHASYQKHVLELLTKLDKNREDKDGN